MNLGEVRYSDNRRNNLQFTQKVIYRFTNFVIPALNTNDTKENKDHDINDIFQILYKDEARNKLIVQDILDAHREGRECIVLSERLEHLDLLQDALKEYVSSLFVLKGGFGEKQLNSIMEAIKNTPSNENRIILATGKYLGEGFDLPSLDTLFLVFPFSWKGTLVQYTGRLNRVSFGKKEIRVYDYVDEKVPVLVRMWKRRVKGVSRVGV